MENIEGIEKLTVEQQELMQLTNIRHTKCVGLDYKKGMQILEVWVDENNTVCVRLKNGDWFHYTTKMEWY